MSSPGAGPIDPFGATVESVYRLVPEMDRVTDPNNSSLPTPITEDTIREWIVEVSGAVASGIGNWSVFTGGTLDEIRAGARAIIANGVASYVEAARYPTRAGVNENSYAAVLWNRYLSGLAGLAALVAARGETGEDVDPGAGSTVLSGPFGAFPAPYFVDGDPYSPWAEPLDPRAAW